MIKSVTMEDINNWVIVQDENGDYFRVRIRKLTPLECFRLMGVDDDASHKMMAVNSKSQCYKQAGNSIVVDNLHAIMEQIFYPTPQPRQTTIFDFI